MNLKDKIERHGRAYKSSALFSLVRMAVVILVLVIFLKGELDTTMLLLIALYAVVMLYLTQRKILSTKSFYTFEPGNPTYDELTQYGNPDDIIKEIDDQIMAGKTLYDRRGKPNKTPAETVITEQYFVHLNKKAIIIPLKEIVCAYLYDNAYKTTPEESFLPTHFVPLYLIITYGERKEAIIIHTAIDYKAALKALDDKLRCKVFYTRELGTLYNSDYPEFLKKVRQAIEEEHAAAQ